MCDKDKLTPVNGVVDLGPGLFQTKGVAAETELRVPDAIGLEAADGVVSAPLAALLFFAALPLLDTSRDEYAGRGGGLALGGF